MKYDIKKSASVPLRADNRESVTLKEGKTLDADEFDRFSKEQVADLVKDGVLKKQTATKPTL